MESDELTKVQAGGKVHIAYAKVGLPVCGSESFNGRRNREVTAEVNCKRCLKSREAQVVK